MPWQQTAAVGMQQSLSSGNLRPAMMRGISASGNGSGMSSGIGSSSNAQSPSPVAQQGMAMPQMSAGVQMQQDSATGGISSPQADGVGGEAALPGGQKSLVSSDRPHARPQCAMFPFMITKDRAGQVGGQNNELFCQKCYCYVCDVKASDCQGWLAIGHCHAQDKDPYWRALRAFTQTEMLSNSPLLQALGCDEAARLEAHRWCVNGLLAFNRYSDGDPGPGGVRNHSFHHVTDVTSSAMKAIVEHLTGANGPRTTLAVLDGVTSAIVINTGSHGQAGEAKRKWCKGTFAAYNAIIEQLEKYWVLATVHTSTRSVPPQALKVMADRLRILSKLIEKQVACQPATTPLSDYVPFGRMMDVEG
jgi:hypothetical protein